MAPWQTTGTDEAIVQERGEGAVPGSECILEWLTRILLGLSVAGSSVSHAKWRGGHQTAPSNQAGGAATQTARDATCIHTHSVEVLL